MQLPILKESCQIGHDHIKEGSSLQMYLDFFRGGEEFTGKKHAKITQLLGLWYFFCFLNLR